MRKPVIGVMGGSKASEKTMATARQLGGLIAQRGWILLTGGRNQGVMAGASEGARAAGGFVVGILPDKNDRRASPDLDLAIFTSMGDMRNVINVLSSDVVIACRGALGTISEVALALNAGKHVILLDFELGPEYDRYRRANLIRSVATPEEAVTRAASILSESGRSNDA